MIIIKNKEDERTRRKKRTIRGIMSLVMAFGMSLSMLSGVITCSLSVKAAENVSNPRIAEDGTVTWDKITFGSYPQDAVAEEAEPIKWRILDIDDSGNAFLLADSALDCKPYNDTYEDCTWETCTLREWLNGLGSYSNDDTAFIKAAFTDEERNAIIEETVANDVILSSNSKGKINTMDKVYLLSIEEVTKADYGFNKIFDVGSKTREAKTTDYARLNGAYISNNRSGYVGNCSWWLRSPGYQADYAAYVLLDGWGDTDRVSSNNRSVRPALHIDLNAVNLIATGTSSGDQNVTGNTPDVTEEGAGNTLNGQTNTGNAPDTTAKIAGAELNDQDGSNNTTEASAGISTDKKIVKAPAKVKISSAKNSKKKSIIIKWKKIKEVRGYEVSYALNKSFTKSKKTKTLKKTSYTANKLKKGKTYFIKVRAYKQGLDDKKVYGKWSAVMKVKVKK